MNYRKLGKTGLMVSEIGFGPEWMTGTPEETRAIAEVLREAGVNYLDCWMPDPHIRANLGYAMKGTRMNGSSRGILVLAGWTVSIFAAVMWHWQNLPSKMSLHCSVLTTSK
ncbi:MAG: hypothetical protein UIQ97_05235 [Eggerthellaceae bacterium]